MNVSSDKRSIQVFIQRLIEGLEIDGDLTESTAIEILGGEATPAQIGGLLIGLRVRGETPEQIAAFTRAMRRFATPVLVTDRDSLVDTCGTGGAGGRKFNISTAAALVAAGAGARVAKHGNRAVSSHAGSGSADVLAALGVKIDAEPKIAARCLETCGMAFFFAPAYHPAMRHAAAPRKELGVRSIFNLLGPLANPAGARRQVIGVGAPELTELYARVLLDLGALHVLIVNSEDGLDEISLSAATRVTEARADWAKAGREPIKTYAIAPEEFGMMRCAPDALAGAATAEARAAIVRAVLDGEPGPRREAVLLNAAAALIAAGRAGDFDAGLRQAGEAIDSGAAARVLEQMIELSNQTE